MRRTIVVSILALAATPGLVAVGRRYLDPPVVTPSPEEVEALRRSARLSCGRDAVSAWSAVLEHDPGDVEALVARGLAGLEAGDLRHAHRDATQATRLAPSSAAAWTALARVAVACRGSRLAVEAWDHVVDLAPSADAFLERGTARLALVGSEEAPDPSRWAWAAEDATQALARAPGHQAARLLRARCRLGARDLAGAEEDLTAFLGAAPLAQGALEARLLRGRARLARRDLAGADADGEAALALDPRSGEAEALRARVRLGSGDDPAEALRRAERAIAAGAPAQAILARARLALSDVAGAARDAEEAVRRVGDAEAWAARAAVRLAQEERWSLDALEDARRATELDPTDLEARAVLGEAALRVGALDEGRAAFDRALEGAPPPVAARLHLARAKALLDMDEPGASADCRAVLRDVPSSSPLAEQARLVLAILDAGPEERR